MFLGDLGADTAATARQILAKVPTPDNAVLLAVSPDQRAIEVVYGSDVSGRGIEESAPKGVAAAAELFKDGKLVPGLDQGREVMSAGRFAPLRLPASAAAPHGSRRSAVGTCVRRGAYAASNR